MKKKMLSSEQAFQAMFVFLNDYYERTGGKAELGEAITVSSNPERLLKTQACR